MKKLLVIGGSYFAGRVFTMVAAKSGEFELTLLNRGSFPMDSLPNVTEFHCDRHDISGLRSFPTDEYDAVVDFCAYTAGDIRMLLENLHGSFARYIFISSVDVYIRGITTPKDENTPRQANQLTGPIGEYMIHKRRLEDELMAYGSFHSIPYTILRPSFLYGPYNYAPRETYYFQKIAANESIPVPTDSTAMFQFLYILDLANIILSCLRNLITENNIYNVSSPEVLTYADFMDALRSVSEIPFTTVPMSCDDIVTNAIPLPFPMFPEETELFNCDKLMRDIGPRFTPFGQGLAKAYRFYMKSHKRI